MKKKKTQKDNMSNFFDAMSYELAGDIGVIDNEEMLNNSNLITGQNSNNRNQNESQVARKNIQNTKNKHKNKE